MRIKYCGHNLYLEIAKIKTNPIAIFELKISIYCSMDDMFDTYKTL